MCRLHWDPMVQIPDLVMCNVENVKPKYNLFHLILWTVSTYIRDSTIKLPSQVLTYHVLKGRVTSGHLRNEMVTKTVQGGPLRINTYPNGVVTAQCAPIDLSRVNQRASNGIVHVLNSAMIPPQVNIFT